MAEHVGTERAEPHEEARLVEGQHEPAAGTGRDQRQPRPEQSEGREDDERTEQPEQRMRRSRADVVAPSRVVAVEPIARAAELERDDRDDEYPHEDVPREQAAEGEQGEPLDREQREEDDAGERRELGVPLGAVGRHLLIPAAEDEPRMSAASFPEPEAW